ncbi:N-sulfoglucosamine sulfohydrolase [Larkinella arboricola]|uniref:N-sulfoglucosamine sulfohydrolase n=1 Tax=Larkinella arboricola TaxID=643671 RepID=A0A327X576_LARAB|nr:sulfatase [Larkinella arboricola]RAK02250.1 N-sulfoglucosamine sulfohydrolase [Larkinella arboricola]
MVRLLFALTLLGLTLITAFRPQQKTQNRKDPRPNIVLIVADDHGREAVGCYGNPAVKTPHIDQLAAEGVRFTNAFCTTASCSPSRSVLLTGLHNHANGMYGLEHREHHFSSFDTVRSLPVMLQKAGYQTARIGKFHVAPERAYHFQKVLRGGKTNNPASIGRSPVEMADLCYPLFSEASEKPFFLYFATDDPHRSNTVSASGMPVFKGDKANLFGNRPGGYPQVHDVFYQPFQVQVPPYLPDTRATRMELAQYYESISRLDQGVERLVALLKETGQYDNTVIVYLSDNGAPFPGSKTTLYEPGMKLPLIVKLPKPQKPGFVQDAMISWVDLTPTLLDFAGVRPDTVYSQGRSFKSIIEQDRATGWDEVYGSHTLHEVTMYYPMRVLRERRYKLIFNIAHELSFPMALDLYHSFTWQDVRQTGRKLYGKRTVEAYLHRPRFELYDLEADPHEVRNLASDPKHQAILKRMQEKLKRFQQQTKDMWVSKWEFE